MSKLKVLGSLILLFVITIVVLNYHNYSNVQHIINIDNNNIKIEFERKPELMVNNENIYDDYCPDTFPDHKVIPCGIQIYKYLKELGYPSNCVKRNCSRCIAPNSYDDKKNNYVKPFIESYKKTTEARRHNLSRLLKSNGFYPGHNGKTVISMVMNEGFVYLFYNFVCSLENNKLEYLKKNILITVFNKKTEKLVRAAGFNMIFYADWMSTKLRKSIDTKAAIGTAIGPHRFLVALQTGIAYDLVELGYDFITQDTDIVYLRDPLAYINQLPRHNIDLWALYDKRWDAKGPANTGFLYIKSNCKTKTYIMNVMEHVAAIILGRSDQIVWNSVLQTLWLINIHFEILDSRDFVNGHKLNFVSKPTMNFTNEMNSDGRVIMIHASWVNDHYHKIEKFHRIGHWYFTNNKCPYFNETMLPDLKNRDPDWIYDPESAYLMIHKIIPDTRDPKLVKERQKYKY